MHALECNARASFVQCLKKQWHDVIKLSLKAMIDRWKFHFGNFSHVSKGRMVRDKCWLGLVDFFSGKLMTLRSGPIPTRPLAQSRDRFCNGWRAVLRMWNLRFFSTVTPSTQWTTGKSSHISPSKTKPFCLPRSPQWAPVDRPPQAHQIQGKRCSLQWKIL